MLLKIHNIKINNRSFTETNTCHMYLPADVDKLIGWLEKYDIQPFAKENAIETYIKTVLMQDNRYMLTFDVNFLIGTEIQPATDKYICVVDMHDDKQESYKACSFDLTIPSELYVSTDDLLFTYYDEPTDQIAWELMCEYLPIKVENIKVY